MNQASVGFHCPECTRNGKQKVVNARSLVTKPVVTLVLVAALRRAKIPARFVLGALVRDGQLAPHTWVQFWDGARFMDLDATLELLDLGPTHVQLMTSETPDPAGFVHLIGALSLRPVTPPSPPQELAP